MLPLPHRRPLLRAGDAGLERDRAAGDHRDARLTGGSLGYTPQRYNGGSSIFALQFTDKTTWYLIALGVWGVGLFIRYRVDRSMLRYALEAIAEDEDAAAAAGVYVTWEKLKITLISAAMTGFAGALYCQYQMFISPDTVSGISVSLQMVFAAVVGGIYVLLGPTVGAFITIVLTEIAAHLLRHQRGGVGQHHLRHVAGGVHHLPAAGTGGLVAGEIRSPPRGVSGVPFPYVMAGIEWPSYLNP